MKQRFIHTFTHILPEKARETGDKSLPEALDFFEGHGFELVSAVYNSRLDVHTLFFKRPVD